MNGQKTKAKTGKGLKKKKELRQFKK